MANQDWTPVEQTATGPNGQKMALVSGEWQPASQTATGPDGAKMALLGGGAPPPADTSTAGSRAKSALANLKPNLPTDDSGKPVPTPTFKSALGSIGTSTALGGALGAVSPEILTAAGFAVSAIPDVGPAIGSALIEAGAVARTARLAAAAGGALSGGVSETAGQVVEAAGGSKATADTARLGAGLLTPGVGAVASKAKGLYGAFANLVGVASKPASIEKAVTALRGVEEAGAPANALHQMLQHGADADIQSAQASGDKVMAEARQRAAEVGANDAKSAQKILDDGQKRADQIVAEARQRAAELNKASGNRMATAGKVLAQSEPALRGVGVPREMSDIGKELQTAVKEQHQAGLDARAADYQALKTQRDAVVKAKEQAGETVDQTPAMKELKSYIKSKTDSTISPRPTTDQGTLRVYGQVNEALQNPSFKALDQVRRKLGDVIGNKDVEGYSAIGKDVATKLYSKISDVQKEFVGADQTGKNLQQMVQEQYHDASIGLRKFGTGAGGKATALDRVDPERFAADPQGVPKQFFSSQQSVRDLKELTGDSGLVQRAGSSYVSSQLRGMSAKQVEQYAQKNSDWLREVPGLQKSVADYAQRLSKIEKTASRVEQSSSQLSKRAGEVGPAAEKVASTERAETISRAGQIGEGSVKAQGRVLDQGKQAATEATKAAAAPAQGLKNILMGGERPEAVRDLLLNGKPEQTRLAARIASQTPQGQRQLEGSVRQITADMTPATLQKQWNERLRPMLQDGKMLPPERLKALDSDIKGLLKAYNGKPPVTLVQRHIFAAIGSAGANYIGGENREQ
jgi:cell division septum initiation protein DivIVA